MRLRRGDLTLGRLAGIGLAPPFILRPLASHGGNDLEKITTGAELAAYLERHADAEFYATPFVDYAGGDGYFRKYRVIFVGGVPFPYHLAISRDWMVHYYNSPMRLNGWMRDEEARFLSDPGTVFDDGLLEALRGVGAAIGLDYFGIDCGITPAGELLVFEIETGMIVHNLDPTELYPYKPAAFRRIASALDRLIEARVAEHRTVSSAAD
ncbi:MAG: hypothetical protein JO010_05705 [Alphaproteobacteria bacterium]|nr:hypothetical protein [Alphaproteobacteria bacterium]